ncbi:WhiB family transcriptional regulator [Streptomyces sp. NPDC001667]
MNWQHYGACRTEEPDLFFPSGGGSSAQAQTERAKAVCRCCPVADQCLAWALDNEEHGVWGGQDENERRNSTVA